jgi:hypothetical protein
MNRIDQGKVTKAGYRVTALYSGLDTTLGLSAGMKHFGKPSWTRRARDVSGATDTPAGPQRTRPQLSTVLLTWLLADE